MAITGWVESHGIECIIGYYVFSAATGGMPTPQDNSSVAYRWIFSSLNLLAGSVARFIATQAPASKMGQALTSGGPVVPVVVAKPDAVEPPKGTP